MSGETRTNISGWTVDTALEHVMAQIASNDRRYEERFAASQKALELGLAGTKSEINAALVAADRAVQKAEAASEKRFEGVNEFRSTLSDQQRTLIPRQEVDVLVRGLDEKIAQLTKQFDAVIAERGGVKVGYGYAVGVAGFVLVLLGLVAAFMRY
jgi:hypothetical protein